ncbi:GNAT family N-acetyltransferase [Nocardioides mesophilus]|uniref:GNAT family N-acetyltransferase n=1 Tax=Nocardioides mesophilus TaxID=433659 RepID=A0A7G9RC71_9ACTN|nr:GNAT family N-acetyltransferase [Nocardioides mesophilus]QNN53196.1 GNAT family N-acetyltransferase [Nocardioides mesophilus]
MGVDYWIRPMQPDDVPAVELLTREGFYDFDVRTHRAHWPQPAPRSEAAAATWRSRAEHFLATGPGGCFVAEDASGPIGAAIALRRELLWVLSTFVVRPGLQGHGVGKQLLLAALEHGRGCLRGLISASDDPLALRRYHAAGFTLHPMMFLRGPVPREVLPVVERVRDGSAADVELMDSVDRRVRDAAHGVDHQFLLRHHRLVVVDRSTGQGYAYVAQGGGAHLLAATNRRTAVDLLWESLAAAPPGEQAAIGHLTAANPWAVDIGMTARMELHTAGYLATRQMKPPAPYLPSGHVL